MSGTETQTILFEKFEIIECLKKDEYSSVYKAIHLFLKKDIILKVLNTDTLTDRTLIRRFKQEAQILAGLDHPNIIKVLDFGKYEKFLYISFEYFKSYNLRELFGKSKLTADDKIGLIKQLLHGISASHKSGVIHRDLKPENILVNTSFDLKIADFGLARVSEDSVLTQKSSIVGTPGYMSPEQIRGEKLTSKSDLFSLGIIIYEIYEGQNPLLGDDLNSTLNNILSFNFSNLQFKTNEVPEIIFQILQDTFQPDIKSRAESAIQLLNILEEGEIKPIHKIRKKRKLTLPVASGLIVVVIIMLWYIFPKESQNISALPNNDEFTADSIQNSQASDTIVSKNENIFTPTVNMETTKVESLQVPTQQLSVTQKGNFFLSVSPVAAISIDSSQTFQSIRDTIIEMISGKHLLSISHPEYPGYKYEFEIFPGKVTTYRVLLDTLCSYFHCEVYPWGEVYLNQKHLYQTPYFEFIRLNPGKHYLEIKNPDFKSYKDSIAIGNGDTLAIKINLENVIVSQ